MGENYSNELLDLLNVGIVDCDDQDLISNVIRNYSYIFEGFTDRVLKETCIIEDCQNSRIRHLALYSRKKRTRKKNMHRAFRIVERGNKHERF